MFGRGTSVVIWAFWAVAMGWLMVEKVLPPLRLGDPPTLHRIAETLAPGENEETSWDLYWNDQPVGWAASRTTRQQDDVTVLRSYVEIREFPVEDVLPTWMGGLFGDVRGVPDKITLQANNRLELDPNGQLVNLDCDLQLADIPIRMQGVVEGPSLKFTVRSLGFRFSNSVFMPNPNLVASVLMPQPRLDRLRRGQTWTIPVYSPFKPRGQAVEILQATVESWETIAEPDGPRRVWVVVLRDEAGVPLSGAQRTKGRMWVREDGLVIKQEMSVLNSRLLFVRVEGRSAALPPLGRPGGETTSAPADPPRDEEILWLERELVE